MAYTDAQAQQQLLDEIAAAVDALGLAIALLGDAYELLDEQNADTLEEVLFRPLQMASGRAKRTHAEFAGRVGLPDAQFATTGTGAPSHGVKGFVDSAMDAVDRADATLATLQDSMLPVDVGDAPLRAGLGEVRTLIADLRPSARHFVSRLGR